MNSVFHAWLLPPLDKNPFPKSWSSTHHDRGPSPCMAIVKSAGALCPRWNSSYLLNSKCKIWISAFPNPVGGSASRAGKEFGWCWACPPPRLVLNKADLVSETGFDPTQPILQIQGRILSLSPVLREVPAEVFVTPSYCANTQKPISGRSMNDLKDSSLKAGTFPQLCQ